MEFPKLHNALNRCATDLRKWGSCQNKLLKMEIIEVKDKIKRAYENDSGIDFSIIHVLEKRLDELLLEEEMYWKQRSREDWLKWGDCNTR